MTREEEIEILQAAFMKLDRMVKWYHGIVHGLAIRENDIKALEVAKIAIEALQTQIKESLEIFNNGAAPESMLNADLISRQSVLDLIEHYNSDGLGAIFYGYEEGVKFADAVNKLPPVQPEQLKEECEEH